MTHLLEQLDTYDLLELVRMYSEPYQMSGAFQFSLKYLIDCYPNKDVVKSIMLTELVECLGEELTTNEIERLFKEKLDSCPLD